MSARGARVVRRGEPPEQERERADPEQHRVGTFELPEDPLNQVDQFTGTDSTGRVGPELRGVEQPTPGDDDREHETAHPDDTECDPPDKPRDRATGRPVDTAHARELRLLDTLVIGRCDEHVMCRHDDTGRPDIEQLPSRLPLVE